MGRKSTLQAFADDPQLLKVVLARIAGAWEPEDSVERLAPQKPWEVCKNLGLSYGAFITYVNEDPQRYELFLRSLEVRAHMMAEETIEIADTAEKDTAHLSKLRIDARQKLIRSWNKRLYGDDPLIQINQVVTDPEKVRTRIGELERRLGLTVDAAPQVTVEEAVLQDVSPRPQGERAELPAVAAPEDSII
jgi:hypothetical protein